MRLFCTTILFAAACGAAPAAGPTTPAEDTEPAVEAAPEPDASQLCDVFTTIRLSLEGCGPESIELEYNPTAPQELAPTDGDSELVVGSFEPQGCAIQGTWVLGEIEVALDVYATGPNQIQGTATAGECTGPVTGSWETWTSD